MSLILLSTEYAEVDRIPAISSYRLGEETGMSTQNDEYRFRGMQGKLPLLGARDGVRLCGVLKVGRKIPFIDASLCKDAERPL